MKDKNEKLKEGEMIIKTFANDEGNINVNINSNHVRADYIAMTISSLIVILNESGIPMKDIKKKLKEYVKASLEGDKHE